MSFFFYINIQVTLWFWYTPKYITSLFIGIGVFYNVIWGQTICLLIKMIWEDFELLTFRFPLLPLAIRFWCLFRPFFYGFLRFYHLRLYILYFPSFISLYCSCSWNFASCLLGFCNIPPSFCLTYTALSISNRAFSHNTIYSPCGFN